MLKLLWANIKMTVRDKQALFWSLLFPMMFIVIFGLFDFSKMGNANYIIINEANSEIATQFQDGLSKLEFLKKADTPTSLEAAKTSLKNGDVDFIIVIPEGFKLETPVVEVAPQGINTIAPPSLAEMPKPASLIIYYDESNITVNQLILSVVDKFLDKMNLAIVQAPSLFSYQTESIQAKQVKYIDVIMPGILGMSIMMSAVIGIASGITRYREQRLLKRLSATPLKVRDFLVAEVLSYLAMNIVQITLIIALARFAFHVKVYGDYFLIYGLCIFGSLIFLNIGFIVAGFSKNSKTADAMSQVITMPMMFFSGVFFSTETLPKVIAKIVQFLPLTPMIDALRNVSIDAEGLSAIWTKLAFMAGWLVVSFLLAWRSFKFKD